MDENCAPQSVVSQSNSSTSSNSELDKDINELHLNGSSHSAERTEGDDENGGTSSNGSLIIIHKGKVTSYLIIMIHDCNSRNYDCSNLV